MKNQITDLQVQKNHPSRLSIYLDGNFYCGVSEEVATKHQLKKGTTIDENELKELLHDEELSNAKKYVYNILARRMYSSSEIRKKLKEQGYTDEIIDNVISMMEGYGYLNDKTFAEEWIRSRAHNNPKGKIVLKRELTQKGIEGDIIEEVFSQSFDESQQSEIALDMARRQSRSYRNDDPISARRKLQGYLIRRGFDFETVRNVVDKVLNE
jgi:regulatory protein